MVNQNWVRWIIASLSKHFESSRQNIPLYIEGEDREELKEGAELRINGPFINNPTKGYYIIDVDVNILINVNMDSENIYRLPEILGIFIMAYLPTIPVYKFGEQDDGSLLGCLTLQSNRGDDIIVSNFGRIAPDIRVLQSTISAIYKIDLFV